MRKFTFIDDERKFWNIDLKGKTVTVTFGKIGTKGQTMPKDFPNVSAAQRDHDKRIVEKLKKGYTEVTDKPVKSPLLDSLEEHLEENPDDLASHMAYADYLADQGDPRGEFIRVQLQLEDQTRTPAERKKLKTQETKLLKAHGRTWLGELAPFLLDQKKEKDRDEKDVGVGFTLARGWLDSLEVTNFSVAFTRVLAQSPQTRLLRKLVLEDNQFEEAGEYDLGDDIPEGTFYPQISPLRRAPYLSNVRVFVLGELLEPEDEMDATDGGINCIAEGEGTVDLIELMPKLEELYLLAHDIDAKRLFSLKTLPNLRILQLYHNHSYPLALLAKNPSFGKLTHLLCHPHALDQETPYIRRPAVKALVNSTNLLALTHLQLRLSDMGDGGVKDIIASGILARLEVLDLRHGCITDKGARLLAECPQAKNLKLLDLNHNSMTESGIELLEQAGVKFTAEEQWAPGEAEEGDEDYYLYAGDME